MKKEKEKKSQEKKREGKEKRQKLRERENQKHVRHQQCDRLKARKLSLFFSLFALISLVITDHVFISEGFINISNDGDKETDKQVGRQRYRYVGT